MKILKLHFKAFGPFSKQELDLSGGQQGLHIIYGPNEAGKSSALRAIRNLLYGIPGRTPDNFIHPYGKMRIGATLQRSDGKKLAFFRRKGQKNTLRDDHDQGPLDEERLNSFLGAVDEDLFQTLFGIDHERLRRGGEEILQGGGKIGELLFSAGGVADLRQLQGQCQSEIESLFKAQGQNPRINRQLAELREARIELKRLQLSVKEWKDHNQALHHLEQRKIELDQERREVKREQQRLNRIQNALPSIAQWKEEMLELKALEAVPRLPEDFGQKREKAMIRLSQATQQWEDTQKTLEAVTRDLESLEVPEDLLAETKTIEDIYQQLGSHKKALQDRPRLETQQQAVEQEAKQLLQELESPLQWDTIEALRLPLDKRVRIQDLGSHYEGLVQRFRAVQRERERLQRSITRDQEKRNALGQSTGLSELRDVIHPLQQQGNLEGQWEGQSRQLERIKAEVSVGLAQLPLWSGSLQGLERLPTPSLETIERFKEAFHRLEFRQIALDERQQEAKQRLQALEAKLEELEQGAGIPTEEQLLEARQKRDQSWQLLLTKWREEPSKDKEAAQFISAGEYQLRVNKADEIADRLRREADRVTQKVRLQKDREEQRKQMKALTLEQKGFEQEKGRLHAEWEKVWEPVGISPLTPREMEAWLQKHAKLVQASADLRSQQAEVNQLQKKIESAKERLSMVLMASSAEGRKGGESLQELLFRSQNQLEQLQTNQNRYEQLTERLEDSRGELEEATQEYQKAEQELSLWKSDWAEAMKLLGLEENATTGQAHSVITLLTDLFQKYREAAQYQVRIKGIEEEARLFQAKVQDIAQHVAPDLKDQAVETIIEYLYLRLSEAKEGRQKQDSWLQEQEHAQKKRREAKEVISLVQAELEAMCQEARCKNPETLFEAEKRSNRRRELEQSIADLEKQLRSLSGGAGIKDFLAAAEAEDPDELESRIEELQQRIEKLEAERDELLRAIQHEHDILSRMDGSAKAAEKAEECELLRAQLEEEIQELAVLRTAVSVLRRGIDRYREKNQGPILERASQLFTHLTLGSFARLRSDFDSNGEPILTGVRPGSEEAIGVEGMSDGTCDQLYLALRIASLENWLAHHEALPFIIDDVLLTFDDGRAVAALGALAELSVQTQVIFFTHHEHLVEIAKQALPRDRLFLHDLYSESAALTRMI